MTWRARERNLRVAGALPARGQAMMGMTEAMYHVFETEVLRLEEELNVSLITRSKLKGLEQGLEQGRRAAILDVAAARFGKAPRGLVPTLEKVSDLEACTA